MIGLVGALGPSWPLIELFAAVAHTEVSLASLLFVQICANKRQLKGDIILWNSLKILNQIKSKSLLEAKHVGSLFFLMLDKGLTNINNNFTSFAQFQAKFNLAIR